MARPKNADGQRTRQAILDAALELFADKGFFGTSLRDVATAVGVRESALYNYFKSKEALFDALILAHEHTKSERLASLADDGPIVDGAALLEQPGGRQPRGLHRSARTEVVSPPDVGRHASGQGPAASICMSGWAAGRERMQRHHAPADCTRDGCAKPTPTLLCMAFVAR